MQTWAQAFIYYSTVHTLAFPLGLTRDAETGRLILCTHAVLPYGTSTRHINIRYYWVKDVVERKEATIEHCPTDSLLANFFTKPLTGRKFTTFRNRILNIKDEEATTTGTTS